jgi:hypothetical protein
METTILLPRLRTALVHLIAALGLGGELCWQAGYRFGVWLHALNAALAARAAQAAAAPSRELSPRLPPASAPAAASGRSARAPGGISLIPRKLQRPIPSSRSAGPSRPQDPAGSPNLGTTAPLLGVGLA